jgi:small subunit ribosomal protein S16
MRKMRALLGPAPERWHACLETKSSGNVMVSIRLSRAGAKKHPFYHLVVTDSRNRRDGRYIERLGFFNPVAKDQEEALRIDVERVEYWISQGARPSDRVASLLKAKEKGKIGRDRKRRNAKPAGEAEPADKAGEPEPDDKAPEPEAGGEAKPGQAVEAAEKEPAESPAAEEAGEEAPAEAAEAANETPQEAAGAEETAEEDAAGDSEKK